MLDSLEPVVDEQYRDQALEHEASKRAEVPASQHRRQSRVVTRQAAEAG